MAQTAELNPTLTEQFYHPLEFTASPDSVAKNLNELIPKDPLESTSSDSIAKNLDEFVPKNLLEFTTSSDSIIVKNLDELIPKTKLRDLQSKRKLCLVLDLDSTLIHSKKVRKFSRKEKHRFVKKSNCQDIVRWNLSIPKPDKTMKSIEYVTKLRPFVRSFLEEANNLFQMCIYTYGLREYAFNIAKILDPEREYFGSRIFARDDCKVKGQKGLDVVNVHESGVIILDDTQYVWGRHWRNLIVMNRYNYFADKESGIRSLSEDGIDEFESVGTLSRVLQTLKEVHRLYFESETCLDVRELLDTIRKEFVVMPTEDAMTQALPILAEQTGAVCLDEYSSASAMRVVCSDADTTEAQVAVMDNKFLVCSEERKQPEKELAVCSSSDSGSGKHARSDVGEDLSEASVKKPNF